jgi:hypothetical protein
VISALKDESFPSEYIKGDPARGIEPLTMAVLGSKKHFCIKKNLRNKNQEEECKKLLDPTLPGKCGHFIKAAQHKKDMLRRMQEDGQVSTHSSSLVLTHWLNPDAHPPPPPPCSSRCGTLKI